MSVTQAAAAIDLWAWWRAALAEPDIRKRQGMILDEPAQGYYRVKWRGKWGPVAYWYDGQGLACLVSNGWFHEDEATHLKIAIDMWSRAAKLPITEEVYNDVLEGKPWPNLDPDVERWVEEDEARARAAKMSNEPPPDENPEAKFKRLAKEIEDQIKDAVKKAEEYENIGGDDQSTSALTARNWLNKLAGKADDFREEEIGDHYKIYSAANARWNPLVKKAKEAAERIRRAMSAWETKKARLEADRQAAIAKQQREQLEREQAEADRQIAEGTPPSQMEAPAPPTFIEPEPPAAPPPRSQIRGAFGRAAAVVMVKKGKIVDQDKVYQHFKEWPEVEKVLRGLVDREVKAGNAVPGVEITEERDVR
jgi:hypothetical protein